MSLVEKKIVSLCSLLALFSCNEDDLGFNTEVTNDILVGEVRYFDAPNVISSDVNYICSLGPYFDGFWETKDTNQMPAGLKFLPVGEGEGYFVYFGHSGELLRSDRLFRLKGSIRWVRSSDGTHSRCLEAISASIRVQRGIDFYQVSLEETSR